MEFNQVVKNRRSIRNFKQEQIDKKVIEKILNDALLSPSAHNKQPWTYYVLTLDKKNEIENLITEKITNKVELTYYEKIMRKCMSFVKEAPVLILAYTNKEDVMPNDILSMGASIEHILLSATNEGLGSLWLGVITEFEKEINENLSINDKTLVSGIVLGYSNEELKLIPRKDFNDVIKFY